MPTITASQLPEVIVSYLDRRASENPTTAADLFTEAAIVSDEGHTYSGRDSIRAWIREGLAKYQYTVTFLTAHAEDDQFTVTNRLQGNFPGGVVDLSYRFRLTDDAAAISELTFA